MTNIFNMHIMHILIGHLSNVTIIIRRDLYRRLKCALRIQKKKDRNPSDQCYFKLTKQKII